MPRRVFLFQISELDVILLRRYILLLLLPLLALFSACQRKEAPAPVPASLPEPTAVPSPAVCRHLEWENAADPEALAAELTEYPELEILSVAEHSLTTMEQRELQTRFPAVTFSWDVRIGDVTANSESSALELQGAAFTAEELETALPLFPALESVELYGCSLTEEELLALQKSSPAALHYTFTAFGRQWDTADTEIDLSNIRMQDTEAVEAMLPHFPALEKVIMCHCGLSDEVMDGLNQKYPDIRFVWMIRVISSGVRTDITYYIAYNSEEKFADRDSTSSALRLRYCTDLEAVDLGHMSLMSGDIDFLRYTPKVRYLILVTQNIVDISPLGELEELYYLELFDNPIQDISPLLNCKKLAYLNISRCDSLDDKAIEVLCQMKQLKALWFYGHYLSDDYLSVLQEALPDCHIEYKNYTGGVPGATGLGWREMDVYFEMRDVFHMPYMSG